MAVLEKNQSIEFYRANIVKGVVNWNILNNASLVDNKIEIQSGGSAGTALLNEYYYGLTASKYLRIAAVIKCSPTILWNYTNNVEIVLIGSYTNNKGVVINTYITETITYNDVYTDTDGNILIDRIITMDNMTYDELNIYVVNHTNSIIKVVNFQGFRSQDINSGQISNTIGLAIQLAGVLAHPDGYEVSFDGASEPLKLWWHENNNNEFDGVNVNNERLISFARTNEIMLD